MDTSSQRSKLPVVPLKANQWHPKQVVKKQIVRLIACMGFMIPAFIGSLMAQDESEEVYQLSPFQVDASDDQGYRSTNSTSGTSLNTAIKDIPMSIEVINAAFMEDTGATDFDEALAYSSGVFLEEYTEPEHFNIDGGNTTGANEVSSADVSPSSAGGTGGRFSNVTIIRGFNVPFQNRDGFRYGGLIAQYGTVLGGIVDTSNVERMEVVRGPNSLLYGIGVLSGIVNIIPKRPLSAQAQSASIGLGSEGYLRTTLDITGPLSENILGGQLNYRIAAAFEERDHWTDWRGKNLDYYVGQLQWQNEKVTVFVEGQYADQNETGIGDQHIHDNLTTAIDQNYTNGFGEQINWTRELGGLPETYRVTGPDTHHYRRENNLMANVDFSPIENLTFSAGTFQTDAKEEEFNVNVATLTNVERSLFLKGVLIGRAEDPNTENRQEFIDWLDENVTIFQNDHVVVLPGDNRDLRDNRMVRYWWKKDPRETSTEQYRFRMAYDFETNFFGDSREKHTFLVGRHDIKDTADFSLGNEQVHWQYANKLELADDDPLVIRNINDHGVIRYNNEATAMPGTEFRNVEVWFTGHYALYQGKLFDEKLGIIAGARHDRFHSRDRQYDRFDEIAAFGADYDGLPLDIAPQDGVIDNPNNQTFGFFPLPDGVSEYIPNPDEAEKTTTKTLALNYKLHENVTLYGVTAEGLTPNTGLRDGNLEGLPSETSTSEELGIKFDLWDNKLSGTVSVYRIERENAAWDFAGAPAPAKWAGGIVHPTEEANAETAFDPALIATGGFPLSYGFATYYAQEEGVEFQKVRTNILDDEGNIIGRTLEFPDGLLRGIGNPGAAPGNDTVVDYAKIDLPAIDSDGNPTGKTWRHYLEKAFADPRSEVGFITGTAGPEDFDPMGYGRIRGDTFPLTPSGEGWTGATVTYTDEATGYDMQLIYSPTENFQAIFAYAHTEREATSSFKLVDAIDPASGFEFGTEYDIWVRTFGRAAFGLEETDTDGDGVIDQVTKNGQPIQNGDVKPSDLVGGLQGTSLYTGSEDAASLWTNYTFNEGRLNGLSAGLGVIYTGPARTSIPIGGAEFASNRFGTPPTAERYRVNNSLKYQWQSNDIFYTLRFNIYNLLDDHKGQTVVDYVSDGVPIQRRTDVYYAPRSYRLTLSVNF